MVGDVDKLGSGRDYRYCGLSSDPDCGYTGGGAGSQVGWSESVVLTQKQLGLYYVLTERPYMVVWRNRRPDFDRSAVYLADDLDHNYCVESVRYVIAGIDPDGLVGKGECEWRTLGCADGVSRANGDAVHSSSIVVGD